MCFPAINPAFSFALSYSWAPTTCLSSPYPSCINTIKVRWNYGYNEPANHRGVDTCTKFNVHCPGSPLTWVVCPSDIANNFSTTLDICDVRLWNPWGISNISVTVETLVRKDQSPCQKKELHNSTRHNPTNKHKHTHLHEWLAFRIMVQRKDASLRRSSKLFRSAEIHRRHGGDEMFKLCFV